jgi:hypothetical protein
MIIKGKHVVHISLMISVFTYKDVVALPEWVLEDSLWAAGCHTPRKTNYYMCIQKKRTDIFLFSHGTYYRMTSLSSPGAWPVLEPS